MAEALRIPPAPESTKADSDVDRAQLQQGLMWLEAHIARQEEKLEFLMQKIFTETALSRKTRLENKMKLEKSITETARKDWEQALAAFHDKTADRDEEVRRCIKKANDAMLEILD